MSTAKVFVSNLFWNYIEKASTLVFGILTSILVVRGLGSVSYGNNAVLLSVASFLSIFTSMKFQSIIGIEIPLIKSQEGFKNKQSYVLRSLLKYRVIVFIASFIIVYSLAGFFGNLLHSAELPKLIIFILLFVFISQINELLNALFLAHLQLKTRTIFTLIISAIGLAIYYLLLYQFKMGLTGYWIGTFLRSFILLTVVFGFTRKYLKPEPRKINMQPAFKLAMSSWMILIATSFLNQRADILVCAYYSVNAKSIGYYNLALMMIHYLTFFNIGFGSLGQVILARKYGESKSNLIPYFHLFTKATFLIIIPFFIFALFQSQNMFFFLYGPEFIEAGKLLGFYIMFYIFTALLGTDFFSSIFMITKKLKFYTATFIVAGMINLTLDFLFVPIWGIWGAVYATGIARVTMTIARLVLFYTLFKALPPYRFLVKCFFVFFLAGLSLIPFRGIGIHNLIVSALIYFPLTIILMNSFKLLGEQEKSIFRNMDNSVSKALRMARII